MQGFFCHTEKFRFYSVGKKATKKECQKEAEHNQECILVRLSFEIRFS